jgi:hypothetical protein
MSHPRPGGAARLSATLRGLLALGVGVGLAAACGGTTRSDGGGTGGTAGGGGSPGGGTGGFGGTVFGGTGGVGGTGGFEAGPDGKSDAGSGGTGGYVDPGCPDATAPPPEFECDPLGPNTCPEGQACYPFINYPSKPCDFEVYGASCAKAGFTQQGEPCGQVTPGSVSLCAPGLSCFITGQGTECLKLCQITGPNVCPPGLLCLPTDVEGVGACD